jgi:sugar phosphate isomerase/epimerase
VVHLSSGENPPLVNKLGLLRYEKIIQTAKKYNVTVAFENQRKLANISYIFELFGNEKNVAFCWDVGHEKCFAHGLEFMPIFGSKLVYTHIHDNNCEFNQDLHLLPFDGKIDYSKTIKHLKNVNYKGTLTLEVIPEISKAYQNIDAKEYYAKAFSVAKKLQNMMLE